MRGDALMFWMLCAMMIVLFQIGTIYNGWIQNLAAGLLILDVIGLEFFTLHWAVCAPSGGIGRAFSKFEHWLDTDL
jgi:hypothetical protein